MFDERQTDLLHGAVRGRRAAAEDHTAGERPPAQPRPHRQPRRLRDGRGGERLFVSYHNPSLVADVI